MATNCKVDMFFLFETLSFPDSKKFETVAQPCACFAVCPDVVFLQYLEMNIVEIRVMVNVVDIYYGKLDDNS